MQNLPDCLRTVPVAFDEEIPIQNRHAVPLHPVRNSHWFRLIYGQGLHRTIRSELSENNLVIRNNQGTRSVAVIFAC